MLMTKPAFWIASTYAWDAYWHPRSEWRIGRAVTLSPFNAIASALSTCSVSSVSPKWKPTIFRDQRSVIRARYRKPSWVRILELSVTLTWLGPVAGHLLIRFLNTGR